MDIQTFGCAEEGTYSTTGPSVSLGGTTPSALPVAQLFAGGLTNGQTTRVSVYDASDATKFVVYRGAAWTDGTPDSFSFASATLEETGSGGAPANSASVVVVGLHISTEYREFYVDAAAMVPRETNGAAPSQKEFATNDVNVDLYLFDAVTEEAVQAAVAMPDDWDEGTIRIKFCWIPDASSSASDTVTWGVAAMSLADDAAADTAFPSETTIQDTVLAAGDVHWSSTTGAVAVSNASKNGLTLFQIIRDVTDSGCAEDAPLKGIKIQYGSVIGLATAWS